MAKRKYYVTFGQFNNMLMADNEYQACMIVFRNSFKNLDEHDGFVEEDEIVYNMPGSFIVSERGFKAHKNDLVIEIDLIIRLMALVNGNLTDKDIKRMKEKKMTKNGWATNKFNSDDKTIYYGDDLDNDDDFDDDYEDHEDYWDDEDDDDDWDDYDDDDEDEEDEWGY